MFFCCGRYSWIGCYIYLADAWFVVVPSCGRERRWQHVEIDVGGFIGSFARAPIDFCCPPGTSSCAPGRARSSPILVEFSYFSPLKCRVSRFRAPTLHVRPLILRPRLLTAAPP